MWKASFVCDELKSACVRLPSGIELCVEIGGDTQKPPLLLITGLGSQLMFWQDDFVKMLMQDFCVVRFDNRDTGLSTKIDASTPNHLSKLFLGYRIGGFVKKKLFAGTPIAYRLEDMQQDVIELIQALQQQFGWQKIHLLGASMGGIVAQMVAAKRGDLVATLSLLFTTTSEKRLPLPRLDALYTFLRPPASLSERDMVRHAVWFMYVVGTRGHQGVRTDLAQARMRYQRDFNPQGFSRQLSAILATGDISHHSRQVRAPTLVLHGDADRLLPIAHGRRVAKLINGAKFVAVRGMAHDIPAYYQPFLAQKIKAHILAHIDKV